MLLKAEGIGPISTLSMVGNKLFDQAMPGVDTARSMRAKLRIEKEEPIMAKSNTNRAKSRCTKDRTNKEEPRCIASVTLRTWVFSNLMALNTNKKEPGQTRPLINMEGPACIKSAIDTTKSE